MRRCPVTLSSFACNFFRHFFAFRICILIVRLIKVYIDQLFLRIYIISWIKLIKEYYIRNNFKNKLDIQSPCSGTIWWAVRYLWVKSIVSTITLLNNTKFKMEEITLKTNSIYEVLVRDGTSFRYNLMSHKLPVGKVLLRQQQLPSRVKEMLSLNCDSLLRQSISFFKRSHDAIILDHLNNILPLLLHKLQVILLKRSSILHSNKRCFQYFYEL